MSTEHDEPPDRSPRVSTGSGTPSCGRRAGQVIVAALVGLLAFAAVTQVRTTGQDDAYDGLRQADLIQALNGLQAASRKADRDITSLETTRDKLRDDSQKRETALDQAEGQLRTLGVLAGTVPATRPGHPDHRRRPRRQALAEPPARRHRGAAQRRRRGARDQRQGPGDRPDLLRERHRRHPGRRGGLRAPYVIDAIGSPEHAGRRARLRRRLHRRRRARRRQGQRSPRRSGSTSP